MEKIIEWIKEFFTSKTHSIGKKMGIAFLTLFVIFFINDYMGISYFYITNMKINHIIKIEEAKYYCKNDTTLIEYLNKIEQKSLNKKSYITKFIDLFEKSSNLKEKTIINKHDNVVAENKSDRKLQSILKENPVRSKLWNTITSSFTQIIGVLLAFFLMITSFFSSKGERFNLFLASIFLLIICTSLIWFLQWIFGLIPVIWDRAYINYVINLILNLLLTLITYHFSKNIK